MNPAIYFFIGRWKPRVPLTGVSREPWVRRQSRGAAPVPPNREDSPLPGGKFPSGPDDLLAEVTPPGQQEAAAPTQSGTCGGSAVTAPLHIETEGKLLEQTSCVKSPSLGLFSLLSNYPLESSSRGPHTCQRWRVSGFNLCLKILLVFSLAQVMLLKFFWV